MAAPPSLKRLLSDQFEEAPEWFHEKFLPAFNGFATDVASALTKGLSFGENLLGMERELSFTTLSGSVVIDEAPFVIDLQVPFRVKSILVLNPTVGDGAVPGAAAQVIWKPSARGASVRFVTGITTSKTYRMLLRLEPY